MTSRRYLGWAVGIVAVVAAFLLGTTVAFGGGTTGGWMTPGGWMAPGGWMGMGMGAWGFGMLFVGLLWMALLVGVPVAFGYWYVTRRDETRADPAMDELRSQYARGEIDEGEYESRRRRLMGQ
ncbi:SHOCT domain-containing protein [Halogeometricum limi]|uniref:Putative membrane protein n=1 Tax=Halogeometricum limi TaxID=555875 RepID=A0A1I6HVL7_9EURY|nr:SHOCT domain-containing protein [Halogeometricum limi]SFR58485.1 putative membrane protein [Halogeometricum limi]